MSASKRDEPGKLSVSRRHTDPDQLRTGIARMAETMEMGWMVIRVTARDTPAVTLRKIHRAWALRAARRHFQGATSSLIRSVRVNCRNGPKLIRPTPSGPKRAGSSWPGSAIALMGSGNSSTSRR